MNTYKGIMTIECQKKKGCLRNLNKDVEPGCMDCPEAITRILDLEGAVLFEFKPPKPRPKAKTKQS